MDNASSLLIMTDAVMAINAPSIDVFQAQRDAHTLLLFVTMEMHAQLINVINNLVNASTLQSLLKILIFAQSKLVMLRRESSTLQRTAMMVLLVPLTLAM
jgi:hypothetical protein